MPNAFRILKPIQKSSKCVWVFRNTGANAFAKNQMRSAYEDKRDLYCSWHGCHYPYGAANQSINIVWSQVPLYIMYFYKSSDDDHADVVLDMCIIKGVILISRCTAGQDWHGWTNLLFCIESDVVLSNKLFDVSSFQLCNHDDAHIILHLLHVTHSTSQYHDNCPWYRRFLWTVWPVRTLVLTLPRL